jgi:hypothetical protein
MPTAEVLANKEFIMRDLQLLRGADASWCHKDVCIMRSTDG